MSGVRGLGGTEEQMETVRRGARRGRLEMFGWAESASIEEIEVGVARVDEVELLDEGEGMAEDEADG